MKGKYLITTDEWFYAPDGSAYKAVWGNVEILEDTFLGVKTNRNSSNRYARIGSEDKHVIIAGCQIHYAVRCENEPNTGSAIDWLADVVHGARVYLRPCTIYIAQ